MHIAVADTPETIQTYLLCLIKMIKLGIKADRYGFENGWFMWPVNFDPAWLLNCNGFTPKDGDVMNGQPD